MAYFNLPLIHEKEFNLHEVIVMQVLKQNRSEENENYLALYLCDDMIEKFTEFGLITYIKKKKKSESDLSVMRLSKKGETLLEDFQTPEIISDDILIYDWLEDIYKKSDKEVGNRKKTKMWIAYFRAYSGISKNKLAYLCQTFINDEEQMEWSRRLEYLFYKPSTVFATKFDIEESRLFKYYLMHQQMFDKQFEEL